MSDAPPDVPRDAPGGTPATGARAHHLEVVRTARYYTIGERAGARAVWVALHGYGQLAGYFARHFLAHAAGRLIVVPEALSRFYLNTSADAPGGGGPGGVPPRVGATWMTREDREFEIADQVRYLDRVLDAAVSDEAANDRARPAALSVLGFSQGATTLCRWLAHRQVAGQPPAERAVLWGGSLPHDLDFEGAGGAALRATRLTLVVGDADPFATAAVVAQEEARLRAGGVAYEIVRHAGAHRLDAETLGRVLGS